jgi:23S rRNA (guanosine2251-2'-O)-methyltransferase
MIKRTKPSSRPGQGSSGNLPKQKSEQDNNTHVWIWGIHPVLELLKVNPGKILEINFQAGKSGDKVKQILEIAEQNRISIHFRKTLINDIEAHQGVEAKTKPVSFLSLDELLLKTKSSKPLFLALDSIQDPHNLGAIIRSASAAGVHGILLPKDRSAPITGTVAKTAAGALALVNFCQVTNLSDALLQLKKKNFWIFGADASAEKTLYTGDFQGNVCIVIGGESKGIRPLVKKSCDFLISIPMGSSLDSLNASVAAGVILFEAVRQRSRQKL